jgi:short-subunit dehydrogenase
MNNYTLITGASKGIGKAIAKEAASRGRNLLLGGSFARLIGAIGCRYAEAV